MSRLSFLFPLVICFESISLGFQKSQPISGSKLSQVSTTLFLSFQSRLLQLAFARNSEPSRTAHIYSSTCLTPITMIADSLTFVGLDKKVTKTVFTHSWSNKAPAQGHGVKTTKKTTQYN